MCARGRRVSTRIDATDYLRHYGHFRPVTMLGGDRVPLEEAGTFDEDSFTAAVKSFQRSIALPENGLLDSATLGWMNEPRCAMADLSPLGSSEMVGWDKHDFRVAFGRIEGLRARSGSLIDPAVVRTESIAALNTWRAAGVGLSFEIVEVDELPDIMIETVDSSADPCGFAWRPVDKGHADWPPDHPEHRVGPPLPLHLETEGPWGTDERHSCDIQSVVLHEVGHCLGLPHDHGNFTAVMHPGVTRTRTKRVLQRHDLEPLAALYA